MRRAESALFCPYRSMGVVCNEIRPGYRKQPGPRRFTSLVCAVDNVVLHYRAEKLRLVAISDSFPEAISHVMCNQSGIYGVAGDRIGVIPFCRDITRWIEIGAKPKHCLLFGPQFIVVTEENDLLVIDVEDGSKALHIEGSSHFNISAIVHPPTYINKIIVGSVGGKLRIYNVRTGKLIHEFQSKFDAEITVLEPTPAIDVIAIGLANGRVILHNVKLDETICSFKHDHRITAIGFRTDDTHLMTTADTEGLVAIWNLEKKELVGRIANVHKAAVTSLYFMPSELIMISTCADNSIRSWILDQADGMPRQLVINEGHSMPVKTIVFSGKDEVISSGMDGSIRKYSVANQAARQKLGNAGTISRVKAKRKGLNLDSIRLEPVVEIAVGWAREAQWDNVLCRHQNTLLVTTWTTRKNSQGTHKLAHTRFFSKDHLLETIARSICVSACGNFAFIGYSSGHLDQFNIQSGRHVRTYTTEPKAEINDKENLNEESENNIAHKSAVNGLACDPLGHELISGGSDGVLQFWDLRTGRMKARMKGPGQISKMVSCNANNLIAVSVEDAAKNSSVSVIDRLTRKMIRTFKSVGKQVTSLAFSANGQWLLTADNESYIRVWELATSSLIDVLLYGAPCIGLSFNETGEFLATCHEGERAIYVWASKLHFIGRVPICALPLDYKPKWGEDRSKSAQPVDVHDSAMEELTDALSQLDPSLVTYSGLAPSRWANLPDLSVIRERNKPIEPPKKPKQAPFFLASTQTLEGFEFETMDYEAMEKDERKILEAKRSLLDMESAFSSSLRKATTSEDLLTCFNQLTQMSLAATDFQIRTLSRDVLPQFMKMLLEMLRTRKNFDLVQAYMATALKIHRSEFWKKEGEQVQELAQIVAELLEVQEEIWPEFDELLVKNSAVLQWTKNALL